MRWLVCGGRYFDQPEMLFDALNMEAEARGKPNMIIEGGCRSYVARNGIEACLSADWYACQWAAVHELTCVTEPAKWKSQGKAAGPIRNQRMLDNWLPTLLIAAPGGKGTADMLKRAQAAGVETMQLHLDGSIGRFKP